MKKWSGRVTKYLSRVSAEPELQNSVPPSLPHSIY